VDSLAAGSWKSDGGNTRLVDQSYKVTKRKPMLFRW